jgi:hypothetical protein
MRVRLSRANATLARTDAALGQARTALAATNFRTTAAQLSRAQNHAADLRAQLLHTANHLSQAQSHAAGLRRQLNATPSPLQTAIDQVKRESEWAEGGAPPVPKAQVEALSAMNYTLGHVSVGAYGYLESHNLPLPPFEASPNVTLAAQAGLCGGAADVFAAIMKALGYEMRSVQFFFSTPSGAPDEHIGVEVFYGGGWHYYDPTYGVYWTNPVSGDVLSIADARETSFGGVEHKDDIAFTNFVENPWWGGDDTAFETNSATSVIFSGYTFNY